MMMTLEEAQKICAMLDMHTLRFERIETLYEENTPVLPIARRPYVYKAVDHQDPYQRFQALDPIAMLLLEKIDSGEATRLLDEWQRSNGKDDSIPVLLDLDPHYVSGFIYSLRGSTDKILKGSWSASGSSVLARVAYAIHLTAAEHARIFRRSFNLP